MNDASGGLQGEIRSEARLSATVRGRVQGVGFRFFVRRVAAGLGLTGYVRNLPEGAVEVVAEGPRPVLEHLLNVLRQGPPHARVDEVTEAWGPATHEFGDFRQR